MYGKFKTGFLKLSLLYHGEKKNLAYGQHSALLYVYDSREPMHYHDSKSISWLQVYTMNPSLNHESKYIPWVRVSTMSPSPYHESKSVPCVKAYTTNPKSISWVPVNTMSPSLYHESKSIPSGKGYLKVQGWKKVHKGPGFVKGE